MEIVQHPLQSLGADEGLDLVVALDAAGSDAALERLSLGAERNEAAPPVRSIVPGTDIAARLHHLEDARRFVRSPSRPASTSQVTKDASLLLGHVMLGDERAKTNHDGLPRAQEGHWKAVVLRGGWRAEPHRR